MSKVRNETKEVEIAMGRERINPPESPAALQLSFNFGNLWFGRLGLGFGFGENICVHRL